jgi:hypothetical protein
MGEVEDYRDHADDSLCARCSKIDFNKAFAPVLWRGYGELFTFPSLIRDRSIDSCSFCKFLNAVARPDEREEHAEGYTCYYLHTGREVEERYPLLVTTIGNTIPILQLDNTKSSSISSFISILRSLYVL